MTWTADSLSKLATGYWQSQALVTAVKLGVFDTLPATAPEVARRISANPRLTTMLLEALTAMALLNRHGEQFHLAPSAGDFLGPQATRPLGPALRLNDAMYTLWSNLPHTVTTGLPAIPPTAHLGADPAQTRRFVLGMHSRALSLLEPVAAALSLSPGLSTAKTLLDVGAGPATLTRMLLTRHPHLTATAVDLSEITAVARELTQDHPTAPRRRHRTANYLTDPLPTNCDAVLYCGALHQHAPAQTPALLQKLLAALSPTGTLYIVDLMLNNERTSPDFSALFALNMALLSPTAHLHTPAEITGQLQALNAKNITNHPIDGGIYHLVTAS